MKTRMMSVAAYVSANPMAFKVASFLFTATLVAVGVISPQGWATGGAGGS